MFFGETETQFEIFYHLKGDSSEGEYSGSFLGLGRPGVEILGLFPLSILDLISTFNHIHHVHIFFGF